MNTRKDTPYADKSFLVTGGAGFIGSHVVDALLLQGATVYAIDDFNDYYDPALKTLNLAAALEHPRFKLYKADIRDAHAMAAIFQDIGPKLSEQHGAIVHLAARAGVRPSLSQPQLYLETNVNATLTLAELARNYGIRRFILASSSSVYGERGQQTTQKPLDDFTGFEETDDVSKPISPYASSKAMAESLLHTYAHLHGLETVALRFFTVYGPRQRPDLAIHKFTRLIHQDRPIEVYGDGSARRDFTYIDDILQGILAAISFSAFTTGTPFEVFNLGESQTITVARLIETIELALGKSAQINWQPAAPGDVTLTCANINKAKKLLGYTPSTPIQLGIPRFTDWFLASQQTPALV
ncbi:MAG: SDR family NAD(P)-dependent oxidoreductase [Vampirovibrionales bacterium]|nr:SDR family NAD(P)-dependent oxidoreductase [Vampirovibrionales bacterium]